MTTLSWDGLLDKTIESGTDRGVLYLPDSAGVPWNGILSVQHSFVGGTNTPLYIDGQKYSDAVLTREFKAVITALFSPEEFSACEGNLSVATGMSITNQIRAIFGLSYRTKKTDGSYKIHLIYNAIATASKRGWATIAGSATVQTKEWQITATPDTQTTFRPTTHFVVDSSKVTGDILSSIEDLLYGTADTDPSLPSVQDLIDLYS